jgi:Ca2+/Na+ antiporter
VDAIVSISIKLSNGELTDSSITNYNVVIVVLSMFLMLVKSIMYMLHVWPPVLSALVHAALIALYTVSVYYQASSDNSDPEHPSNGPVWYITKNCNVASNPKNVHYCTQAKAAFAATVAALGIFVIYFGFSVFSMIPSKAHREEVAERRRAREEKWSKLEALHEEAKGPDHSSVPVPDTPGPQKGLNPMTPRTLAFNKLGGTKDLPLRNHFSSPNAPKSPEFQIRSPTLPRSPMNLDFGGSSAASPPAEEQKSPQMYFPPPPKKSKK